MPAKVRSEHLKANHRIIEWLQLKVTLKIIKFQPPERVEMFASAVVLHLSLQPFSLDYLLRQKSDLNVHLKERH